MTSHSKVEALTARRLVLIAYIDECRLRQDWHGVRDAATDIEVCQAELTAFREIDETSPVTGGWPDIPRSIGSPDFGYARTAVPSWIDKPSKVPL